jgi:hypothetical protein
MIAPRIRLEAVAADHTVNSFRAFASGTEQDMHRFRIQYVVHPDQKPEQTEKQQYPDENPDWRRHGESRLSDQTGQ